MVTRIAMLFIGVIGLIGLFVLGKVIMSPAPVPQKAVHQEVVVHTKKLLTVRSAMHAGDFLRESDLVTSSIPDDYVPPGSLEDTPANRQALEGALLRMDVPAGGGIVEQSLLRVGDHGFLSAVLKPGMRALSIGVNLASGVSGLVEPGDRVDVVMTERVGEGAGGNVSHLVSKIVLSGIRVVAVGGSLSPRGGKNVTEQVGVDVRTVTLEVTPEQSAVLGTAQQLGQIVLAVQSLGGPHDDLATPPVWEYSVSAFDSQQSKGGVAVMHVYNGISGAQDVHF
ncbi:Flp pilus assembly protein CpaB [Acetobacter lambici]|uniref:Flp pilus assembly protein CpaB n=1 Tax=Acetobacter lambici TaxID=1332824 RepID=A0ABT1F1U2_9PROT|nr:Flp pilus assembly protein CpaB [Acetobacter lambici]MCP1243104.1 Flp pilus assembly protein CpaB [Acetobacter lambici]MCP1259178.1 Flp pilus assembly protein CpaB [Acetobacter lambici]NHO56105.1 Flp pilus assembly protein CpaB [Acetobacter lambici]